MNAHDLINKQWGTDTFDVDDEMGVTAIAITPTRFLANNPNCVQLTIINTGGQDINIWTDATVSATKGIRLQASGGSYEIDITRFGTYPTREWWAIGISGTSTLSSKRLLV